MISYAYSFGSGVTGSGVVCISEAGEGNEGVSVYGCQKSDCLFECTRLRRMWDRMAITFAKMGLRPCLKLQNNRSMHN